VNSRSFDRLFFHARILEEACVGQKPKNKNKRFFLSVLFHKINK